MKEPAAFTKIAFGDGNYELTWEKPRDITGIVITNYTLFWCEHNKDRPYQCTVSKSEFFQLLVLVKNLSSYNYVMKIEVFWGRYYACKLNS